MGRKVFACESLASPSSRFPNLANSHRSLPAARGGLGDSCEGAEGLDDSLCAGNLGCSPLNGGTGGGVCGGIGAECLYSGNYVAGDSPNHQACVSGEYS